MDPTLLQSGIALAALAALAAWVDRRMIPLWERSLSALEASTLCLDHATALIERLSLKEHLYHVPSNCPTASDTRPAHPGAT